MTKLMEWLSYFVAVTCVWISFLIYPPANDFLKFHLQLSPIYAVVLFGLTSVVIVLYRVATFNDCVDDYVELKKQITEAREDLVKKGFKFDS